VGPRGWQDARSFRLILLVAKFLFCSNLPDRSFLWFGDARRYLGRARIAKEGSRKERVKHNHEFRDPIHVFITLDSDERRVVDSRPFQRLRYIHQLAASYLVFSGATHRRFEHSLGVMHLAGQVFDVVMAPENVHHLIRPEMPGAHQLG